MSFGSASATITVDSGGQNSLTLPPAATADPVSVTLKTKGGSNLGSLRLHLSLVWLKALRAAPDPWECRPGSGRRPRTG